MPTYDYQCRSCGSVTEVIHSMLEAGPSVCELCGGPLRRVLYPAGIIFKGSGFYRTDSRKPEGGADGSTGSAAAGSAGSTADAAGKAPDAKSDTSGSAGATSDAKGSTPSSRGKSPKKD